MSTAPRDGTHILVDDAVEGVMLVAWKDYLSTDHKWHSRRVEGWIEPRSDNGECNPVVSTQPLRWLPVPEPLK